MDGWKEEKLRVTLTRDDLFKLGRIAKRDWYIQDIEHGNELDKEYVSIIFGREKDVKY